MEMTRAFQLEYIYIWFIYERQLETKVKEHFRNIKNGVEKSAVAAYARKEKHAMDHKPVLLKQASNE